MGLPLGFFLLISIGIILWQERRIQKSKKHPAVVDKADLLRAAQAATSRDHVMTMEPYVWHGGEMPITRQIAGQHQSRSLQSLNPRAPEPQSGSRRTATSAQSGRLNSSDSDEVHELYSPAGMEPRNGL